MQELSPKRRTQGAENPQFSAPCGGYSAKFFQRSQQSVRYAPYQHNGQQKDAHGNGENANDTHGHGKNAFAQNSGKPLFAGAEKRSFSIHSEGQSKPLFSTADDGIVAAGGDFVYNCIKKTKQRKTRNVHGDIELQIVKGEEL